MQRIRIGACQSCMRSLATLTCLCCLLFSQKTRAQLFFSAGVGQTYVHSTGDFDERYTQNRHTWEASVTARLPLQPSWFFETGLTYQNRGLSHDVYACCTISIDETIQAQYLILPVLVGKTIPLQKNWQLDLMAGPYVTMGVAGSKKGVSVIGDWFPHIEYYDKPVNFKSGTSNDLSRWNFGIQAAASLNWKRYSLQLKYSHDFNKFAKRGWYADDLTFTMSNAGLLLGYRLFSLHK